MGAAQGGTPFGALPVLEVDAQTVAQSNAINRYVGKLADLYPSDPWQARLETDHEALLEAQGLGGSGTITAIEGSKL